jgi:cell division protein FtsI/penicillin-binding protein 2/cell division protein FtsW (lipid II flippase)
MSAILTQLLQFPGAWPAVPEWIAQNLQTDTQRIQAGLWLLVGLALVYGLWELIRRRPLRRTFGAYLVSLPGGKLRAGEKHEINGHEIVIGRAEDADIRVVDRQVAAAHAVVVPAGGGGPGYFLKDMGSREGVRLNGRPVARRAPLRDGDLLDVAGNQFRFQQESRTPWRPELWTWVLLAVASALFIFMQWSAWAVAGPARPAAADVNTWSLALVAGVWGALLLVRMRRGTFDPVLVPAAVALLGLGLAVLLRTQPGFYDRQMTAAAIGVGFFTAAALVPLKTLGQYRYLCLLAGVALLMTTLLFGSQVGDQQLAINLFGLQFQPAEPAKLLLAIFLAGLLSERQELVARTGRSWTLTRTDVRYLGPMVVAWLVSLGLLILKRDLGTALLFFGLFVAFIGMASGRAIFVLLSLGMFAFGAVISAAAFDRVRERMDLWMNPWQDPQGLGYQLSQALFALGAGGVEGIGLGKGFPYLVPAAHTDLPMAVIGEELGLIGTLGVLALLGVILWRGYRTALRADDDFLGLLAAGLTTVLALQAIVIVGGLTRLLPLTGVTLPFVSFGGTSLVTNLALIGILVGVSAAPPAPRTLARPRAAQFSWRRQLRWVMAAALVGFVALGSLLWHWQARESQMLTHHPNNPRLLILEPQIHRGKILSVHGEVIADSVYRDGEYRREVPTGSLTAGMLGYTSRRRGRTGVEAVANRALLGATNSQTVAEVLRRTEAGTPGDNVRLTINMNLQRAAAEALGNQRGSVVALDPQTGAIKAMVSNPRFSLHRIDERWEELTSDPQQPLLFRASHGVYAPGSTYKVITAAIALDSGLYTPESRFSCPGAASIGRYTWRCYGGRAHGGLTLSDALRVSCNVTFGRIGHRLGKEKLIEGSRRLGIGVAAPMEITTGRGLLDPYDEPWGSVPAQIGFGQGPLAVTPLQMALAVAGVANDGVIMKPHLIQNYETPGGTVYGETAPEPWIEAMNPTAARQLRQMMARVVEAGTGGRARVPGIQVGGKTGTAENPHGPDHAWFVALAPVENPKLAVAVVVEAGGLGGRTAAPIAQKVIATHYGVGTGN